MATNKKQTPFGDDRTPLTTSTDVVAAMTAAGSPRLAHSYRGFFRTGPGGYGEGDDFVGIRVPQVRSFAKRAVALPHAEVVALLQSPLHEVRLCALVVMASQFEKGDTAARGDLVAAYLDQTAFVNNWDLVDASAHKLIGRWLLERPKRERSILRRLAKSTSLWERRIAIVATYALIQAGELDETFDIAARLLGDPHDLIHKAVGWMLREAGKKDEARLIAFLREQYAALPRTALRYAIEKFPPKARRAWIEGRLGDV
jgi:3-methyladenine DNA glycosylase AlkD